MEIVRWGKSGLNLITQFESRQLTSVRDDYPHEPESKGIRPLEAPKDWDGSRLTALDVDDDEDEQIGVTEINFADFGAPSQRPKFEEQTGWKNITSCPGPIRHRIPNKLKKREG
jgi:hypothetical protein